MRIQVPEEHILTNTLLSGNSFPLSDGLITPGAPHRGPTKRGQGAVKTVKVPPPKNKSLQARQKGALDEGDKEDSPHRHHRSTVLSLADWFLRLELRRR